MSEEEEESECEEQDKLSSISKVGFKQLQLLIFFLAFFHVLSSFLTFGIGIAKSSWGCLLFLSREGNLLFRSKDNHHDVSMGGNSAKECFEILKSRETKMCSDSCRRSGKRCTCNSYP
ncbi:uncharacterized protein LOC111379035 isoform X3 [Olea europaea var. sylvestris]|uniref:uncharacterized protein LOC111379035 isoform X3 n=1 Tax=Olea europaea var. sylvestris TaxID=158386 RepID=UPI000C1D730F|nr:uncharacterized protein LOC111379035 isoform X3 [Olea europaea var. sylvestris]XP_022858125.1 uncharacterized protein LOC111379035 isoform X3 [Olea europaea var. sylvestris]XP_022858126.1 uncharacterized protein LOC111379035 isoform X3 [Olea europaea var. sylvestris]